MGVRSVENVGNVIPDSKSSKFKVQLYFEPLQVLLFRFAM
jgi:hypothetical protein